MKIVTIGNEQTEVALERDGNTYRSGEHELEILDVRDGELDVRIDGRTHVVPYIVQGATVWFSLDGEVYIADVADKGARAKARHRDHSTAAPMPGIVLKILVKPGDVVAKGAALLILEAMKMEHAILAPRDGVIAAVNCREGEMIQPGVELITMNEEG